MQPHLKPGPRTKALDEVLQREVATYLRLDTILQEKIGAEAGQGYKSLLEWIDVTTKKARAVAFLTRTFVELDEFERRLEALEERAGIDKGE